MPLTDMLQRGVLCVANGHVVSERYAVCALTQLGGWDDLLPCVSKHAENHAESSQELSLVGLSIW